MYFNLRNKDKVNCEKVFWKNKMRLSWLLFLCLTLSLTKGRPESATNPNPKPQTPDEGSTKLQKEDGNEKGGIDEAGLASLVSFLYIPF